MQSIQAVGRRLPDEFGVDIEVHEAFSPHHMPAVRWDRHDIMAVCQVASRRCCLDMWQGKRGGKMEKDRRKPSCPISPGPALHQDAMQSLGQIIPALLTHSAPDYLNQQQRDSKPVGAGHTAYHALHNRGQHQACERPWATSWNARQHAL